jgi:hypothetical protein
MLEWTFYKANYKNDDCYQGINNDICEIVPITHRLTIV